MKGLQGWMRLLDKSEAAVLSTLLDELDRVTASDDSSGEQLATIILKDANLTANVIRVANSVIFNPIGTPVTTVSRAIINLGFKQIRSLCLSIKLLESILQKNSSPLLLATLTTSLHAASQAKALCYTMTPDEQEEVFVACLLSHLTELLVLSIQEDEVAYLSYDLEAFSTPQEKDRAAEKHLGVSLTRLSKTLIKQWRMQGLVMELMSSEPSEGLPDNLQAIHLGNEISRVALLGWESDAFKDLIQKIAKYQSRSPKDVKKSIIDLSDVVSKTLMTFGEKLLVDYLPTSQHMAKTVHGSTRANAEHLMPDDKFKNYALMQIKKIISDAFNINTLFKAVLSGLHQGVGLERVSLSIYDKSHAQFLSKYATGDGTENWKESFVLRYEKNQSGFLYQLFQRNQRVWVGGAQFKEISNRVSSEFLGITGQNQFFIAPLQVGNNMIGFLYADMGSSSRPLTLEYFEGFQKFVQQLNMALNLLSKQ